MYPTNRVKKFVTHAREKDSGAVLVVHQLPDAEGLHNTIEDLVEAD